VLQTKGLLPSPIKIVEGGRAAGYLETEIDAFINSRFSASRGGADHE
jgi:predicted DNA-binding transcriptional regulator AlpA